jgi:hypothetical protein
MSERREVPRPPRFAERLSLVLIKVSVIGAVIVLIDIHATLNLWGQIVQVGGDGFSLDTKGLIVGMIIVGGYVAVKEHWFGQTATGQAQTEAASRVVEAITPKIASTDALTAALNENSARTAANTEAKP